jgi:predicted alpha/beta hydrolase family esterase
VVDEPLSHGQTLDLAHAWAVRVQRSDEPWVLVGHTLAYSVVARWAREHPTVTLVKRGRVGNYVSVWMRV